MEMPDIGELVGKMAVDAINIQLKLDLHYQADVARFEQLAPSPLLMPLAPRRLRAERFDLSFQAAIRVTREEEFAVRALPLNAQFFIRTSATTDRHSRLSFSVHQVPTSKEQSTWP